MIEDQAVAIVVLVVEAIVDLVEAVATETKDHVCLARFAQIVEKSVKFHSNQPTPNRFIAVSALNQAITVKTDEMIAVTDVVVIEVDLAEDGIEAIDNSMTRYATDAGKIARYHLNQPVESRSIVMIAFPKTARTTA